MATVSILIPAHDPDFLGRALLSARQQTYADLEILVGDDTVNGRLEAIVKRGDDHRVRYFHHGFQDRIANMSALWERARGQYVKWLFGDDVLMPTSVGVLVEALEANPESALAFHERVVIDETDAVRQVPDALLAPGTRGVVDRSALVRLMIGGLSNFIGELSNVMVRRAFVRDMSVLGYRSIKLAYLNDVAMYLNLAERAPLVAVGGYHSGSRRPSAQQPGKGNPTYSAGLYEWELFVRGEAAAGRLDASQLAQAAHRLESIYGPCVGQLPEIARLHANLPELTQRPPHELFDSPRYQADLASARAAVADRAARRQNGEVAGASASAPVLRGADRLAAARCVCVVCEQAVDEWIPQSGKLDTEFMSQIEVVGSTLQRNLCPRCGCNDRDRHLWLYIAFSGVLENAAHMRILHVAPEHHLEPRIRRLEPLEYVVGDLFPHVPGHRRIDVEALDFPDGHFDLVICNNVLEHVADPERALAELHRSLKPGGHLIARTPYSAALKYTFELTKRPAAQFAVRYFGKDDHLRFFGANIVEYFRAAGFEGELLPHAAVLGALDAETLGCNEQEPFFFFCKGTVPSRGRRVASWSNAGSSTSTACTEGAPPVAPATVACAAPLSAAAAKPVRLVCATRVAKDKFLAYTALGRSLAVMGHAEPPEIILYDNNTAGLPSLYNAAIEQAAGSPAILVFVHDDVSICDFFWMERIQEAAQRFDIVGLAGNRRRLPLQPAWAFATPDFKWDDAAYLSGSVGHGKGFPSGGVSRFGPAGVECKLLDGLMLIADSERLVQAGVRFDEQFAFHFYDMDFCRQAESKGLRMGTWPISVVHESGGAFGSAAWRAGYERYLRKYGE